MKKLLLPSAILAALCASSCSGVMEMKKISMEQVDQINDSIAHNIPGTASIHILQGDDYSKAIIIIRNASLYANKDRIPQTAVRTGMMVLGVLGKDNNLSNAILAVTQIDDDGTKAPDDAISGDMKIDSLKKVMFH